MGLIIGLIKILIKLTIYFLIFASIVVLIPNLPPYTSFTIIPIEPTLERVGPLAPNGELNNAERLYKGKLLGPEAFQTLNGELYTSLATGEIVKITPGGHITFVTKLGQPCTGLVQEHICGRPLGFQIDEKNIYVADAYHGIWKVDLKTDKKQLLVSPRVDIDGRKPMLFNSVAKDKNGNLYWTDSTSDFNLKDGVIAMLSDPSGRLFQYNAAKNESKVLVDNLWFANGLVISPDNQFVIVAETSRYRLQKYYINGPNKGKTEIFVAGLPGPVDNIRALPDGSGMLVALFNTFDDEHPAIAKTLAATPVIRKFVARLHRLIEIPFEYLNNLYPHVVFEDIIYYVGHFKSVSSLSPGMAGLVQIDWNGNIVASYYNTDGSLGHISDAIVYNDRLYTGSPHVQDFIGSVPAPSLLKKAFTLKKSETVAPKAKSEPVKQDSTPAQPPKVEVKKDAPKITKPVVQDVPKQKPTENVKPTTEKPIEKKAETVQRTTIKPQQQPKQAKSEPTATKTTARPETKTTQKPETKTTPPPKSTDTKPKVTEKSDDKKPTTAKPEVKSTPMPKSADKKTESPKTTTPKPDEAKSKQSKTKQQKLPNESKPAHDKPSLPEQIPIREEIPSDTRKPDKETLKVIKKGGPAEIPNFN